jgi:tetratricopeptide (TPR) repeat protein
LNTGDLISLQRKAAMLLLEAGKFQEAFTLFQKIEDYEEIVKLVLIHAQSLIAQGRLQLIQEWLKSLPEEIIANTPWLNYWLGFCLMPVNPNESAIYFERAFQLFKTGQNDLNGLFLSLIGIFNSLIYGFNTEQVDSWIAVTNQLKQDFPKFPSDEVEVRFVYAMFIALSVWQPEHPDLIKWEKQCLLLLEKHKDSNFKTWTLSYMIYYLTARGDFPKAGHIINLLESMVKTHAVLLSNRILMKMMEAFYYINVALSAKCSQIVSEALKLAHYNGLDILAPGLLGYGALNALNTSDFETARRFIQELAVNLSSLRPIELHFYHFVTTWEALLTGNLPLATYQVEQVLELGVVIKLPHTEAFSYLEKAIVLHELGKNQEAKDYLEQGRSIGQKMRSRHFEFIAALYEAQFAFDLNEEEHGLELLKSALTIGREHGYVDTYLWRPSMIVRLAVKALAAGIETDYVRYLIRRRNLAPDFSARESEDWPWLLKIYTLGRFEIIKDDRPLQFSGKSPRKPLEMLKAIIALGGRNVSQIMLSDALWPEASGDLAHHSFETTLYRLRQLLGDERLVQLQEGRVSLNPQYTWVDAWSFEQILERVDISNQNNETIRIIERGLKLYQGDLFTGDMEQPRLLSMQEDYKINSGGI